MMSSNKKELIGNFEVSDSGVVTRREVLLMGAMAAGTLVAAAPGIAAQAASGTAAAAAPGGQPYVARDFSHLIGK
ncbi:MAG TPA: hypothetical protein V6C72_08905, partial [Chroococcales cyanobacterium]